MKSRPTLCFCITLLSALVGALLLGRPEEAIVQASPDPLAKVKSKVKKGLVSYWKKGPEVKVPGGQIGSVRSFLWKKYREKVRQNPRRKKEHREKKIHYRDKVMKYFSKKIGKAGKKGYPLYICLHGGGGAPSRINDSQWRHMKIYYRSSVKRGIYVAPRGITNTWDLHFVNDSYPLYDRLIENMIAFEKVNPNRVYLAGFSAGGDGVYQIAPRLADRLGAANMSAGHPNGTNPKNLYNLAFLIQVGQYDKAYKRNTVAIKYDRKLDELQKNHPKGYIHEIFVHAGRGHNFYDMHPRFAKQRVLARPFRWLKKGDGKTVKKNTNAISWLKQYVRNPLPKKVIWELGTRAERWGKDKKREDLWPTYNRGKQFYWLSVVGGKKEDLGEEIIVTFDGKTNTFQVKKAKGYLRILLSSKMVDFQKPISLQIGDQTLKKKPSASLKTMVQTLLDRGDPHYIFEDSVTLVKGKKGWKIRD